MFTEKFVLSNKYVFEGFFLELISVFLQKKLKIWYSKFIFGNKKNTTKLNCKL